jgi:hypothetical protein
LRSKENWNHRMKKKKKKNNNNIKFMQNICPLI